MATTRREPRGGSVSRSEPITAITDTHEKDVLPTRRVYALWDIALYADMEQQEHASLLDLLRDGLEPGPASTSYLDHLVSLSLDDLLHEPTYIASESASVEAELTNLCYREYTTFISAHKCSAAVYSAFDDFGSSLRELVEAVPALEEECRSFTKGTTSAQSDRHRVSLVQEHQNKLAELLELPQLMETCVRNGFYQEAMDLAAHTQMLSSRYPNALVNDVAEEVDGVLQMMMTQLLGLLREPIKLPTLVKAVGFLRKLCGAEDDLGLAFLQSRLYNYRSQLAQIDKDKTDPVRYIRRYIDLFREHVYDIISQYSAIFDASIHLVSFASQAIDDLVDVISTYIPRVSDSASLSSILVQVGYCALSFSRVGLDFALLANEHFLAVIQATYSQSIATATSDLTSRLKSFTKSPVSEESISNYPPLAHFLNAHLEALNALRLLAPFELKQHLVRFQHASLTSASGALLQYFDEALVPETPSEPSSPRSQLLRRNTETQLTPEIRAAKRRETRRACVSMARLWRDEVITVLVRDLGEGVYEDSVKLDINKLDEWLSHYEERPTNGEPRTPPRSPKRLPRTTEESAEKAGEASPTPDQSDRRAEELPQPIPDENDPFTAPKSNGTVDQKVSE